MHKGVILLVKAEDKDDAISKVNDFMEPYGEGDVWDWFAIGGRWSNTLAPKELLDKFKEKANTILERDKDHGFLSMDEVEKKRPQLQAVWEELGLKGPSPYADHYKLPEDGATYDAVPLSDCIVTVKEWVRDLEVEADKEWEEMEKARKEAKSKRAAGEKPWDMSAYHAKNYANAVYNNFCFDSCVYDITEDQGESIPENIEGYWAVMVDMHN